jgi:NRPS condensation-like uncharacterized protein
VITGARTHIGRPVLRNGSLVNSQGMKFNKSESLDGVASASRSTRPTGHSPVILRPLGAIEQFLWLLDQNSPRHFVLAAEIEGPTTVDGWRRALDLVQQRHPFWSVCIETNENSTPYFRQVVGAPIPVRLVTGDDARLRWESEIGRELALAFDAQQAPLLRAVLLHSAHRSIYLLAAHHSVADGLSLAFAMRDTLEALAGKPMNPLPVIGTSEELLGITRDTVNREATTNNANSIPTGKPATYLQRDGSLPQVEGLRLTPELTDELRRRARQEGTTVHGALCSALGLAFKQLCAEANRDPIRIWSPIDIRKRLGLGEDCAMLAISKIVFVEPQGLATFWDVARDATTSLAAACTLDGMMAFASGLHQTVLNGLDAKTGAQIMAQRFAYEICLTNLGNLPYETSFGELKLVGVWGPSVLAGFAGAQTIGAATTNGSLCLLHASYTPVKSLLGLTQEMLVSACSLPKESTQQ